MSLFVGLIHEFLISHFKLKPLTVSSSALIISVTDETGVDEVKGQIIYTNMKT